MQSVFSRCHVKGPTVCLKSDYGCTGTWNMNVCSYDNSIYLKDVNTAFPMLTVMYIVKVKIQQIKICLKTAKIFTGTN